MRRWWVVVALACGAPAAAQTPTPTPQPVPLDQDKLDLQGRASLPLGAGARAFGMGGAFLSRADDATAASWNPAGLSYLRRPEVSIVGRWSSSRTRQLGELGEARITDVVTGSNPDFLSAAYPVDLGAVSGAVQLSFQRVVPFSGERRYRTVSRFILLEPRGGFDVLALGSGFQVSRRLRVGATVNRWRNGLRQSLDRYLIRSESTTAGFILDSEQELAFRLTGWNVNLGLIWSPWEDLNVGVVGKTALRGDVVQRRERIDYGAETPPTGETTTRNEYQRDDVLLKFPGSFGTGVSWRPIGPLTLSLDYTRTYWSRGEIQNFFTLPQTPRGQRPPVPRAPDSLFETLQYPTLGLRGDQNDAEQFRFGVEYVVLRQRLKVPLRLGYFSDRQYFKADGRTPRFNGYTAGTGLVVGPLLLDVAYVIETGQYRDTALTEDDARTVRTSIRLHRFFVSLIYRYGANR